MDKKSINRMRKNFILVAFLSFTAVMLFIGGLIYVINSAATRKDAYDTLQLILESRGDLTAESDSAADNLIRKYLFITNRYRESPEFTYQTRYFYVTFDEKGETDDVITEHIAAVTRARAIELAEDAKDLGDEFSRTGNYYYLVEQDGDETRVAFLDCRDQLIGNTRILFISFVLTAGGALASFLLLRIFSFRIIQPELRNMRRQKQFITNASHELKTPLAVIRANTELDMMMNGENEWNKSTMRQVDHMTKLIQTLVTIAKYQERASVELIDTDLSKIVHESAESFRSVADQAGKTFEEQIQDGIHMKAEPSVMEQLTGLLVDNAIKYCDDGGSVSVALAQKGKTIRLVVSNTYADGANHDYSRFFERFYRQEEAHTQGKGGFGIGLSMAESIMEQYHGSINASWKDGVICFTCTFHA
jgi:two-component system sensor histidine kinase CiaH